MKNADEIREIIAGFIDERPENIRADTVIDRTRIKSSIAIHKMYGAIRDRTGADAGDYREIRTVGDLLARLGGAAEPGATAPDAAVDSSGRVSATALAPESKTGLRVGIDMESVAVFPVVGDYREDGFYRRNFSDSEISYCIRQASPAQSFALRFALKEAIVKADNGYAGVEFSRIDIRVDEQGRPYFEGFEISASHSDAFAVAVAVRSPLEKAHGAAPAEARGGASPLVRASLILAVLAFLLSAGCLYLLATRL